MVNFVAMAEDRAVHVFLFQGPRRAAHIRLAGPFFVVGRGEPFPLFADDPTLSREHFAVVDAADGVRIKDLGSRNGVFVNGRRLERYEEVGFGPGDVLQAGNTRLRLVSEDELARRRAERAERAGAAAASDEATITVDGAGTTTGAHPLPAQDEDLDGEVTGALPRPGELDLSELERTQWIEEPSPDDDDDGDPERTQVALDDDGLLAGADDGEPIDLLGDEPIRLPDDPAPEEPDAPLVLHAGDDEPLLPDDPLLPEDDSAEAAALRAEDLARDLDAAPEDFAASDEDEPELLE